MRGRTLACQRPLIEAHSPVSAALLGGSAETLLWFALAEAHLLLAWGAGSPGRGLKRKDPVEEKHQRRAPVDQPFRRLLHSLQ